MDYSEFIIFIMEIIGTIAFASSGAMLAVRKEMDLFGVCVLGVTASVGGGLIRDLILGITPPSMFRRPVYTLVAVGVSVLLFLLLYILRAYSGTESSEPWSRPVCSNFIQSRLAAVYDRVMALFDAAGLGIFTVSGIHTARSLGFDQTFLLVFLGVITGVGGGLLRDVIAQEKPYILTKHVYACASIAGALVCVWVYPALGSPAAMAAGALAVFLVRLLAMRYRWNLPRIR